MSFTEPKSTAVMLRENLFLSSSKLLAAVSSPWLVAVLLHPRAASSSHCLLLTLPPPLGSAHFGSVAQTCSTLCKPTDCSMPGLPVHHQLPEVTH